MVAEQNMAVGRYRGLVGRTGILENRSENAVGRFAVRGSQYTLDRLCMRIQGTYKSTCLQAAQSHFPGGCLADPTVA